MKKREIHINIYEYDVTYIEITSPKDKRLVEDVMVEMGCSEDDLNDIRFCFDNGFVDGGFTFRNLFKKTFLVLVFPCTTKEYRRMVVNHEKRHVEDRILEHCEVKDIEAAAYLAGHLSMFIY
jgi:hypothetical protein